MLHYRTVQPRLLELLKQLMQMPVLMDFGLAGGTALALYYGHRASVDIDLFAYKEFDTEVVITALERQFPDFQYSRPNEVGIFGFIGDIKVDFIKYQRYQLLAPLEVIDGVRIYSVKDIMAMKVAAVMKRAVKKDFWDIAELLEHFELEELINCYKEKYPNQQLLITVPQAISYFDDANESETPVSLKNQTWAGVKHRIQSKVSRYLF